VNWRDPTWVSASATTNNYQAASPDIYQEGACFSIARSKSMVFARPASVSFIIARPAAAKVALVLLSIGSSAGLSVKMTLLTMMETAAPCFQLMRTHQVFLQTASDGCGLRVLPGRLHAFSVGRHVSLRVVGGRAVHRQRTAMATGLLV